MIAQELNRALHCSGVSLIHRPQEMIDRLAAMTEPPREVGVRAILSEFDIPQWPTEAAVAGLRECGFLISEVSTVLDDETAAVLAESEYLADHPEIVDDLVAEER